MKFPSKVTCYRESLFPIMTSILNDLESNDKSPIDLCMSQLSKGYGYKEILDAMDALFSLGSIVFSNEKEDYLHYAERNTL